MILACNISCDIKVKKETAFIKLAKFLHPLKILASAFHGKQPASIMKSTQGIVFVLTINVMCSTI
jgi:hypothetical protein